MQRAAAEGGAGEGYEPEDPAGMSRGLRQAGMGLSGKQTSA